MEPVPAEQVSTEATPVVQPEPKPSQPDIETRLKETAEQLRREHQEELAALRAQIEEDQRRTRQSLRDTGDSIVKRVNERFARETGTFDKLVADGHLTQDEADSYKARERFRIENEELKRDEEQRRSFQQQHLQQEGQRVISTCNSLLQKSGLVQTDPEFNELPLDLNGLQPDEAIKTFKDGLEKAQAKKKARGEQEQKQKIQKAQEAAPFVDLGTGGGSHKTSQDDIIKNLNEASTKGDLEGVKKWAALLE